MEKQMARREFVGAAALGVAGAGLLLNQAQGFADEGDEATYIAGASEAEDATDDVDVLIAGSGTGGLACAIECASAGLKTLVVESESTLGGASAHAEGIICLHSDILDEAGYGDMYDTDEVIKGEYKASQYVANYQMVKDFISHVDENYQWMRDDCGVQFDGCNVFQPCQHYYVGLGEQMINTLAEKAQGYGAEIRTDNRLVKAIQDDEGKVVGAIIQTSDDETYAVKAKAVVLATGCFLKDKELTQKVFPWVNLDDRTVVMSTGGNYGDGQRIAWAAGGDDHCVVTPQLFDPILKSFPFYSQLSVAGCNTPYLFVNEQGERFINEDLTIRYSEICLAIFSQRRVISILTQSAVDRLMDEGCPVGWAAYVPTGTKLTDLQDELDEAIEENAEEFYWADSFDELAEKTGIPADNLKATVERYRELVAKGEDEDFGKDPQYLWEVPDGERLYAFELRSWFGNAMGGIVCNNDFQVITTHGEVIPGLYAAGAAVSGPTGFLYSSDYGSTKQGFCLYNGRKSAATIIADLAE